MFGNWSISTRDLLSSKIMNFKKKHTFYKRKINTSLNLTQFHIPNHNTNLKMNLYENSIFYVLSWPLEKQKDFEQFFFLDLIIPANTPTTK